MDLVTYISKLQTNVFALRNDDDFADRLNYRYTVAILVAFAIIVSHRQFSESVIKCWVPAFFTQNYEAYANQVCWISNTYYVNQTQNVPKGEETRKSSEIKYYQWIPFILLIQALFLYIPRILWRLLSARAGLDVRDIIEAAHSYKSVEKYSSKSKIMDYIVENIDQYASNPRRSKSHDSIFQKIKYFGESLFCGSGIYLGNYLVTTYFFIKIVYLVNSISQFFIMNEFLGKQFHELGLDILRYLTNTYNTENYIESVYFPKVVMCDFRIREFGHPNFSHRYTIQCVLPINLYNQQIFTFLWFWFLILFCANLYALFQWINRMMPSSRRRYVNRRLNMLDYFKELNERTAVVKRHGLFGRLKKISYEAKMQKRRFIDDYLKFDGVFILRMISSLTSEIVCKEILHELWIKRAILRQDSNSSTDNNNHNIDNDDYLMTRNNHYPPPPPQPPPQQQQQINRIDNNQFLRVVGGLNHRPSPHQPPPPQQPSAGISPRSSDSMTQLELDKQVLAEQKRHQQRLRMQTTAAYLSSDGVYKTPSVSSSITGGSRTRILRSAAAQQSSQKPSMTMTNNIDSSDLVIVNTKNENNKQTTTSQPRSALAARIPLLSRVGSSKQSPQQSSNNSNYHQQQLLLQPYPPLSTRNHTLRNQSIDSNISKSSTASRQKRVAFVTTTKDNDDDDKEDDEEEENENEDDDDDEEDENEEDEDDEEITKIAAETTDDEQQKPPMMNQNHNRRPPLPPPSSSTIQQQQKQQSSHIITITSPKSTEAMFNDDSKPAFNF